MRTTLLAASVAALSVLHFALHRSPHEVAAGTAVRLDLDGLTARSELVIEGRVIATRALRDLHGKVATEYTLDVQRTFLGEPFGTRVVQMPGGVLADGTGMVVPGMPSLALGEDVFLFLTRESKAHLRMPVGMSQGKLRVVREPGREPRLERDASELLLLDPATGAATPATPGRALDYASFVGELERSVARTLAARARGENGSDR